MSTPHRRDADTTETVEDQDAAARIATTAALIQRAISERLQVIATYDGHRRGLCPHLLGTSNGRQQALCYQFSGTSRSVDVVEPGLEGNWRCIPLAGLSDVSLREGPWHTADNYAPTQTCVGVIEVAVADAEDDRTASASASDR